MQTANTPRPLRQKCPTHGKGFTLIELMIVLVIVAIIGGVGLPSMFQMTASNRITTQTNELLADINFTRSEAIKQGARITLCSGTDCQPGASWDDGWVIFEDTNDNNVMDPNEPIFRVHDPINNSIQITFNNGNILAYNANGRLAGGGAGSFAITDGGNNNRSIVISPAGRARTEVLSGHH